MKPRIRTILSINLFITVMHIVAMSGLMAKLSLFALIFYLVGAIIWLGTIYSGYKTLLSYLGELDDE